MQNWCNAISTDMKFVFFFFFDASYNFPLLFDASIYSNNSDTNAFLCDHPYHPLPYRWTMEKAHSNSERWRCIQHCFSLPNVYAADRHEHACIEHFSFLLLLLAAAHGSQLLCRCSIAWWGEVLCVVFNQAVFLYHRFNVGYSFSNLLTTKKQILLKINRWSSVWNLFVMC